MTFHKYPKIKALGDEENKDIFSNSDDVIIIQEKMDGSNFRFMIKDGKVIFGSRTQELGPDKEHKYEKNFQRCIAFVNDTLKGVDLSIHSNLIFYGENMVKHSMNYDWEKIPPFLGFDIFNLEKKEWVKYEHVITGFELINLPTVPLIKICKAKDIKEVNDDFVPDSVYASISSKDKKAEGVVFKNYSKQIFAKFVMERFKEKNREVFGGSKKHAKDDTEFFVLSYCTNARIDKQIFKLMDEGEELNMKLMHKLPNLVYEDIWEENWREIIKTKKTINLRNFKSKISKRCLEVLKQVLVNNSLIYLLKECTTQ